MGCHCARVAPVQTLVKTQTSTRKPQSLALKEPNSKSLKLDQIKLSQHGRTTSVNQSIENINQTEPLVTRTKYTETNLEIETEINSTNQRPSSPANNTKNQNVFVEIEVADQHAFNKSFIRQRQQAIDNNGYRSAIDSWKPTSLEKLANRIKSLSNNKSLIDCHWIIFYWIATNIEYDTISYFSKNYEDQTAEGVFRTKKGVCAGYANIYQYLCDALNLPCEKVSGYSKGYGFDDRQGVLTDTDHAWNAVEIDQHWYLMESTWGAGHLTEEKLFQRQLNTYYFLPRPNEMIYHHLPETSRWQLLRAPITMRQYLQIPKLRPVYFQLNLDLISPRHQAHVDLLPDKSYAEILIRTPSDVQLIGDLKVNNQNVEGGDQIEFDHKRQIYCCRFAPNTIGKHKITIYAKKGDEEGLYSGALDLDLTIKDTLKRPISFPKTWQRFFDFNMHVVKPKGTYFVKLHNEKAYAEILIRTPSDVQLIGNLQLNDEEIEGGHQIEFDHKRQIYCCRFAPNTNGKHKITIYATKGDKSSEYGAALELELNVKETLKNPISFPKTSQRFFDLNMDIVKPKDTHLIKLHNGEGYAEILIKTPPDVQLIGNLQLNDEKIEGGHEIEFDHQRQIYCCRFAPNTVGKHKIKIYVKKADEAGSYSEAVNFDLTVTDTLKNPISFPETWQRFFDLNMHIVKPKDTHLIKLRKGAASAEVLIKTPEDVELLADLVNAELEKIKDGHRVFYDRNKRVWRCNFAPNKDGIFDAQIYAKKKSDEGLADSVVSFKVDARNIPLPPLSYPTTWPLFYELGLQIEAPRNRSSAIWPEGASFAEIRLSAPDDVEFICEIEFGGVKKENCALAQFDQDKQQWQFLFAPQNTGLHRLLIYARHQSDSSKSFSGVVEFDLNVTKLWKTITFPLTYGKFRSGKCRIYTPLDGVLKRDALVPVHCIIPGAYEVDVQVDSNWVDAKGYKDPVFKTEIRAGSNDVTIYAKYDEKSKYGCFVQYSVQ